MTDPSRYAPPPGMPGGGRRPRWPRRAPGARLVGVVAAVLAVPAVVAWFGVGAASAAIRHALHLAPPALARVRAGDAVALGDALRRGADPNLAERSGITPLMQAAGAPGTALLDTLLAHGADPNVPEREGFTALYVAARAGNVAAIRRLAARGAQLDRATVWMETPLMAAMEGEHLDAVRALLDAGANLRARTGVGTALSIAVFDGHVAIARELMARGADPDEPLGPTAPGELTITARELAKMNTIPAMRALMASAPRRRGR